MKYYSVDQLKINDYTTIMFMKKNPVKAALDFYKKGLCKMNYTDTDKIQTTLIKQLDNLHIETRPISPEQETKFLYYNMAVDDCLKVVRAYLESVTK